MKKLAAIWKDVEKRTITDYLRNQGKPSDPPLREQLRQRQNLLDSVRIESYLEACRRAPDASEGTKKKWKRALKLI